MEGGLELHDHAEGIILNFIFLQTLTLFSLLIIAIFDEFESKISKFEHMDKCLSVDYKYNIHLSGFRECAK